MENTRIAPIALDGWFQLNQFFRLAPPTANEKPASRSDRVRELESLFGDWEDLGDEGWSALYRIIGGSTDYMVSHFRPSLEELGEAETALLRSPAARDLVFTGDYLSVVELSMYHLTDRLASEAAEEEIALGSKEWKEKVQAQIEVEREKRYVQDRLHPRQPEEMPYVCFYPMNKRRNHGQNWYMLPVGERAGMMRDHGMTGRRYAGRISQIISGSIGLDDWEWAVTLFAKRPNDFKELVAEMRYDEVSAVYAEFGTFWVGYRVPVGRLVEELDSAD